MCSSDASFKTNPELAPPVSVKSGYTSPDGVWVATWTTSNGVISFEVTVKRSGDYWGAIGFNTQDSMVGADIALGYVSSSNVATVTDRHATAHAEPSVDSVNNLVLVSGTRDAASTVFRFSRSLTVTDTNDVDLSSNVFMLWAYGQYDGNSGAIFKHANKGTVTGLQFATDCYDYGLPRATNATLTTSSLSVLLPVHGLLAVLSFACVGPLGSVAAVTRLSGTKLWFPIHIVLHVVSLASAVAAFVIIFVAKSGVLTVDVHQIMGIVVFGLSFVQAGVGLLSHFMYDKNRVSTPIFPDAVHHWFGRALFVLATVTMFYGLVTLRTLYGLPSSVAPFALLALTIAIPLVFYLVLLIRGRKTGPVSQGYNMGQGEDFSASTQGKGVASAAKTLFVIACVAALVAFGGFVVTLYVPRYSYGGGSVATPNSFSLNVPTKGCFAMDRYSLPPSLTAYKCRGFQFPNSPQQHAYSFSPVIDKAAVVHHIILYRTATYLGDAVFDCSSMPAGSSPFWAWAVGGGDFVPPSNTAFEAAPFFALQIHYNNPALSPTFVDSSGVKISFTPQKPQDKSVFLQVGVATSRISLPPRQTTHLSYTCSATSVIPVGASVEIWANGLHAHLRGKKIWIEHIRNSARIGFIGCNLFYDFNKQSFEMRNATIQRGDSIKIHCQYDTTQETSTVVGGEATTNGQRIIFFYVSFFLLIITQKCVWRFCLGTAAALRLPPICSATAALLSRRQWARACFVELKMFLYFYFQNGDAGRLAIQAAISGLALKEL